MGWLADVPMTGTAVALLCTLPAKWFLSYAGGRPPAAVVVAVPLTLAAGGAAFGVLFRHARCHGSAAAAMATCCIILGLTMVPDAMFAVLHLGRPIPYADAFLASCDSALGFDWRAYATAFDRSPTLWQLSKLTYEFMFPQMPLAVLALAYTGQGRRLAAYVGALALSLAACVVIVGFMPAQGAYAHFGGAAGFVHADFITADSMTSSLEMLRMAVPISENHGLGLISFPSFHTVCAVLGAWATLRTPYLRWPILMADVAMLAATPVQGSHYLIDLVGGAVVALLALAALRFPARRAAVERTASYAAAPVAA